MPTKDQINWELNLACWQVLGTPEPNYNNLLKVVDRLIAKYELDATVVVQPE